jgi:hypothetical protein
MGTPNTSDGTQLGTGEVVSNEAIGLATPRGDPAMPQTAYKLPRSKIAVGAYGDDVGDAIAARPLYVESYQERRLAEMAQIAAIEASQNDLRRYAAESQRGIHHDARGQSISTRGVR